MTKVDAFSEGRNANNLGFTYNVIKAEKAKAVGESRKLVLLLRRAFV